MPIIIIIIIKTTLKTLRSVAAATTTIFITFTAGNLRSHSLHTVTQRKSKTFSSVT